MVGKAQRRVSSEGGASDGYCVLCREEGKPNETARDVVTIKPRNGGRERRVTVCLAHLDGFGKPESLYEVVAAPVRGIPAKGLARQIRHVQGKSEKGNINRTLRRAERYSKGQRGRLGE
jgi:hypothetical protein